MIIVIGTGAVAAEITMFFPELVSGYLEYSLNIDKYYKRYGLTKPILGDIESYDIQGANKRHDYFVLGAADIGFREMVINKIISKGGEFVNLIHKSAIIGPGVIMRGGNVIYPQCIISTGAVMGNFNLLTCQSIISHDCTLRDNNVLATALLCGHVEVGENNTFGIRSTVIPHVTIGNRNIIQAGMTVDKNIADNTTVFYKHKEKIIITNPGHEN